jgi:hypothetical protein
MSWNIRKKNELTVQCCRFWIVMACPFQLAVAGLTLPFHHGFWFRLVCSKNQILQLVLLKRYKSMFLISEFWRFRDNYLFSMMSFHWHFELISEFAREYTCVSDCHVVVYFDFKMCSNFSIPYLACCNILIV